MATCPLRSYGRGGPSAPSASGRAPAAPPGSALPGRGPLPLPPRSELSEGEGPCVRAPFPSRGSPTNSPFVAGTTGACATRGGAGGRIEGPGTARDEGAEGGGGASASTGDAGATAATGGVGIVRGEGGAGASEGGGSWGGIARRAGGDSRPGTPELSGVLAGPSICAGRCARPLNSPIFRGSAGGRITGEAGRSTRRTRRGRSAGNGTETRTTANSPTKNRWARTDSAINVWNCDRSANIRCGVAPQFCDDSGNCSLNRDRQCSRLE